MDADTIASLATAAGTLILAVATFSSTRSANRAARVSEEAFRVGLRPVLFNARPQDPPQKVGYGDDHWVRLRDGLAAVQEEADNLYLAIPLRNVAAGLAVLHGWHVLPERAMGDRPPATPDQFRRLQRDLYVPAGDISFWQGAIRDPNDPMYGPLREAIRAGTSITIEILYGDHEGGQRVITRFVVSPRSSAAQAHVGAHAGESVDSWADDDEPWLWMCTTSRHWNLDHADPR